MLSNNGTLTSCEYEMMMIVGVERPLSNFSAMLGQTRFFVFCERLMIESMGVRTTARKGGLADTLGNCTRVCHAEVLHAIH